MFCFVQVIQIFVNVPTQIKGNILDLVFTSSESVKDLNINQGFVHILLLAIFSSLFMSTVFANPFVKTFQNKFLTARRQILRSLCTGNRLLLMLLQFLLFIPMLPMVHFRY